MSDLYTLNYNPDVLSCLANLSNDEVFTPPEVVNAMLDMLPQELFQNPNTTFLDPACKSGVFLREIGKRLLEGLKDEIPDLQERIDHIFQKQLYGISITAITSLLSRRSVYCSKYANSRYSVTKFENIDGNIRFKNYEHTFKNGKCIYCGASEDEFGEKAIEEGNEIHAYEWLHTKDLEEIFNMKFDVIISNPPYQLNDGGNGISAKPIYNLFVEKAIKLNPRYLTMIIPSRWFAGGKGLDVFRREMLNDRHITVITDYINAKDCFPGTSIGGGVCYFLREKDNSSNCKFTSINGIRQSTTERMLNEFDVFIRYNEGLSIVHKVNKDLKITEIISTRNPFGFASNDRGRKTGKPGDYKLYSRDNITFVDKDKLLKNMDIANKYKIMISRFSAEHAGEPDSTGMFRIISRTELLKPGDICTDTYIIAGGFKNELVAHNCLNYIKTKFVRFLMLQALSSINITRNVFKFVPMQDFSKSWTDEELYKKYNLTEDEISFIESIIKPMD